MVVKAVQLTSNKGYSAQNHDKHQHNKANVSFSGAGNPVITLMDAIDRGGFAASFIMQDFLGMAGPRVLTGMYRNHDKTGQLNWDFAKKEGIREVLSGPSAFLIPLAMMTGIKKVSGKANNVPIDFINGLGDTFAEYVKNSNGRLTKREYYEKVFENMLSASTDGGLKGEKLTNTAKSFAARLVEAEKAPKKGFFKNLAGKVVEGSSQDLKAALQNDFVKIRKQFLGADGDKVIAQYASGDKKIATPFKSLIGHMSDYADDALKSVNKKVASDKGINVEEFVKNLNRRRSGTRFLSIASMWLAVVGFYTIIPKLYNRATNGRDPGLDGLGIQSENVKKSSNPTFVNDKSDNVAFTGLMGSAQKAAANLGDVVTSNKGLSKLASKFEFDGASMSMPAMMSLLFGFCLPPRLIHAQSNTDRKEILFRDVTSFVSILFGAKAMTRVFSDMFAKKSGLALNIKPEDHNKSMLKKVWDYVYPNGGVQVLDSERIVANYSDVASSKGGLNDMFRFVDKNGGNVGKMLNIDDNIRTAATEILGEAPNKNMKLADIIKKFDSAKDTKAYKRIIETLADSGNTIVKRAKTYNSAFGFASTVFLVPALMIWISKHCENMTKKRVQAMKEESMRNSAKHTPIPDAMRVVTNKPTMAGFLNKQ